MCVLSGHENKTQCFDLLANKSVSLAESQHGVLSRQGSIMRQVRVYVPTPSFTTCAI